MVDDRSTNGGRLQGAGDAGMELDEVLEGLEEQAADVADHHAHYWWTAQGGVTHAPPSGDLSGRTMGAIASNGCREARAQTNAVVESGRASVPGAELRLRLRSGGGDRRPTGGRREAPGRRIPAKRANRLLVASWNVANLGLQDRTEADHALIAEILPWFDLVALQETNDNLSGLRGSLAAAEEVPGGVL